MKRLLILIIVMLLISCAPADYRGLSTKGQVVKAEADRIYVVFEDRLSLRRNLSGDWFYMPGIGLIDKNEYRVEIQLIKIKH